MTVARALGLPDQPGQPTMDVLLRFIRDRQMLLLLDNCEHLLDASAELITALLARCPALTLLTTSREPIGVRRRGELAGAVAVTGRRSDRAVQPTAPVAPSPTSASPQTTPRP